MTHPNNVRPPEARHAQYRESLFACAPRLLSALNRCPVSASSGSFDREYWAWCTKDFANQDLQRATCVLAWLYCNSGSDTPYHGERALLTWAEWSVRFWLQGQARCGAFDHLYPVERSWMASAFTLTDMVQTYAAIGSLVAPDLARDWRNGMTRAGEMLCRHDETHGFISNHRAGAAAGLLGAARILGGNRCFETRAMELLDGVLQRQSAEGFFWEYEGADPGYETLGLHYLAKVHAALPGLSPERATRLEAAVRRSLEFLSYSVHPDGSLGGEYGSRGCPQVFTGGLEYFARMFPLAEGICAAVAPALASGRAAGLADADIRNLVPLATSTVSALEALAPSAATRPQAGDLPRDRAFERFFPLAGLYVRSHAGIYTVIGTAKGGVVKVYDANGLLHSDCGYTATLADGSAVSTHVWQESAITDVQGMPAGGEAPPRPLAEVRLTARMHKFHPAREMRPFRLVLFRLFSLTLGRMDVANRWLRKAVIRFFVTGKSTVSLAISRRVRFTADSVDIVDTLLNPQGLRLRNLARHGFMATVYMASARYFRRGDLRQAWSEHCPQRGDGDMVQHTSVPTSRSNN